jgi:hypothetical protein
VSIVLIFAQNQR